MSLSLQTQAETIAAAYQPPATGRPSDIGDAPLLQQLFDAIKAGNYLETACDLVGLSPATVYSWKKRGDAGEVPYDAFLNALKRASAQAEAQAVANVRTAGKLPQFWAAEMTYLERRHPEKWSRRTDDSSTPKVVVQIGVGAGDVKVGVLVSPPTFAPDSPLEDSGKLLTDKACAFPSSPISALMVTTPEASTLPKAIGESRRADPEVDPTGAGTGHSPVRKAAARKGAPLGRLRKKKAPPRVRTAPVARKDGE